MTDANLVLGRLDPERFLGGEMKLDVAAAERALGQDRRAARHDRDAGGRRHPAHRRDRHVLRGQGRLDRARPRCRRLRHDRLWRRGAAACFAVAREIGMRKVIIPGAPGHFCAFGMLFSDLRYDYVARA